MRTHPEFRSPVLRRDDDSRPSGEAVARLLEQALPELGVAVEKVAGEDWGWRIMVANSDFPLWIGCGDYLEHAEGHLRFIEPSRPALRKWFRAIDAREPVEALADAIEMAIAASGRAHDLRWWSADEVARR
jgi:hypothetical protein